jgi:hypothetical protein
MSRYFLTKLSVEGFRGINNENQPLELKFNPTAVNSVFAANATGKSSIFEALCFAIRGYVPKLQQLQAGEHPERYVVNLFHSVGNALVELELEDEGGEKHSIEVQRSSNGQRTVTSSSGLTDPIAVLKSLDEDFTLLDYEQFTNFINRTPLERGRSFAALLGLSGYSQLRQLLQTLSDIRTINSDFDLPVLMSAVETNESYGKENFARFSAAYTELTGQQPADTSDVAQWGADIRSALVSIDLLKGLIGDSKLSEIDFSALRDAVRKEEGGPKREELAKLVERVTRLDSIDLSGLDEVESDADSLAAAVRKRAELLSTTPGAAYQRLHEAAGQLYRSSEWHDPEVCALCKSKLSEPLLPKIEAEIAKFEAVRAQEQEIRNAASSAAWVQCLRRLEYVPELRVEPADRLADGLVFAANGARLTEVVIKRASEQLKELASRLSADLDTSKTRRAVLEKELPPSLVAVTTQIENAALAREGLHAYWRATKQVSQLRSRIARFQRWQQFITSVYEQICEAEARLTSARLDALGNEYKELFRNIMGVGDVVPTLARSEHSEQLDVQLEDFHGLQGLSARALLSESYRNALAVSVFLSAAAQQTTAARFVILDDITSSFDAGHQFRLMDEIRTKLQYAGGTSGGLQFILLSHDGLLEKYFDKVSAGTGWHHQRLQGWPPLGAVSTVGQTADRLRRTAETFLAAGQVKEAEPLIRQYLEYVLMQVIRKVNIPVPFDFSIRDQLQMVGNALDAILTAVKLQDTAGGLIMTPQQVSDLELRHVPALVANWVSHYSTAVSANLSPPVLLGVLQSVDDLADSFKWQDTTANPPARRWYRSLTSK